jgi:MT0933-like antitoxin protein
VGMLGKLKNLGRLKSLAGKNASKITKAVDKVGDVVDKKTKGKHHDKIVKAESAAGKALGKLAGETGAAPGTASGAGSGTGTDDAPPTAAAASGEDAGATGAGGSPSSPSLDK